MCSVQNELINRKKENGYYIVKKTNIWLNLTYNDVKIFLFYFKGFLYTCKIELDNLKGVEILKLLIAADQFGLELLYEYAIKHFIKKHEDYIKENLLKF